MGSSTGLIGIGMSAAGTAASSYAAYQQAKAEKAAAEWNAGIMEDNAKLKDLMSEQELQRGEHNAAIAKREGDLLVESQRGYYAAGGIKVDTGSALDVVLEQAGRNQYDQDMIQYNAELAAWGHQVEGANLRAQAKMTRSTGRNAGMAAFTTALSGTTALYNQYRQYSLS